MNEFVLAILEGRKPLVDVTQALNMTVGGIVAHESALKDGERMKVPQYKTWGAGTAPGSRPRRRRQGPA